MDFFSIRCRISVLNTFEMTFRRYFRRSGLRCCFRGPAPVPTGALRRRGSSPSRRLRPEQLETRRLLVSEGAVFEVSETIDTTGLVGDFTSTINWGDGTSTVASVTGTQATSPLSVRFIYPANDTFFSGANVGRRAILEAAADSIVERFTDDLAAIAPGGIRQWTARTPDPTTGQTMRVDNLAVAQNELVIYAGGRDFGGGQVGEGAPGTYEFPAVSNLTQQQLNEINAFRTNVITRGQTGTTGDAPTDFATWGGTLAFDTTTDYYFGADADGLGDGQVDFLSVASHELLHVLGFGVTYTGATSSWQYLTRGGSYTGAKGNAAYTTASAIPLSPDAQHFDSSALYQGRQLLTNPVISRGVRYPISPVDLAVMDDIGWTTNQASATVTSSHYFPDDGNYPVEIVVSGSVIGDISRSISASVTNVVPTLAPAAIPSPFAGQTFTVENIGSITDPGFRNDRVSPPTARASRTRLTGVTARRPIRVRQPSTVTGRRIRCRHDRVVRRHARVRFSGQLHDHADGHR